MTETDQFLADVMPWYEAAELALHQGDAQPRIAMWSRREPLTLFGAAVSARGWTEIGATFEWLGTTFDHCQSYEHELIAAEASGDLAYIVAREHSTVSISGKPVAPYVLRVTTVFRREDGEWKVVHRHGDSLATESGGAVVELLRRARDQASTALT